MTAPITNEEAPVPEMTLAPETRQAAPPAPVEESGLPYHVIAPCNGDRVKRFLQALAAILAHTNYKPLLDQYCASSARCSRCTAACPVYQATGDPRDIPCYRTGLLLETYRRHFTVAGWVKARPSISTARTRSPSCARMTLVIGRFRVIVAALWREEPTRNACSLYRFAIVSSCWPQAVMDKPKERRSG